MSKSWQKTLVWWGSAGSCSVPRVARTRGGGTLIGPSGGWGRVSGSSAFGCLGGGVGLRGESVGCSALAVPAEGEGVGDEGEAEEVEVLAAVAEAVGAAEPEGVFEGAVDGFGVVAAPEEPREVGVAGRDGPEVFGAVEPAGGRRRGWRGAER